MTTMTPEESEKLKRDIFERIAPRRRKYIERIGYENWDPFQEPKDPIEIRGDITKRTTQQLVREYFQQSDPKRHNTNYARGVWEFCLGVVNNDERYQGMFDFCLWYQELLKKEGKLDQFMKGSAR